MGSPFEPLDELGGSTLDAPAIRHLHDHRDETVDRQNENSVTLPVEIHTHEVFAPAAGFVDATPRRSYSTTAAPTST